MRIGVDTLEIKAQLKKWPPWEGGTKVYINGPGHMTKMAATPIYGKNQQGQLLEGVECHIYLYCFTFDDINLNRAFVIIVLFPKKYSNKKVCANDMRKKNALGIY